MAETTRFYGTGHRKDAVARVWLVEGTGRVVVNDRELEDYFPRMVLMSQIQKPFVVTETLGRYDVKATAEGGGIAGQAGALRHGIARALLQVDEQFRVPLKKAGLLTRDSRVKERKKAGRKRARRGFQFSKR